MIRFEIVSTSPHQSILEVVTQDFNPLANILEDCKTVKEYKAFNGSAQFSRANYAGFIKLVTKFHWQE